MKFQDKKLDYESAIKRAEWFLNHTENQPGKGQMTDDTRAAFWTLIEATEDLLETYK